MNCPDFTTLIDLEAAAHWRALATVEHVAQCADCRAALRDAEAIHQSVAESPPATHDDVERVMQSISTGASMHGEERESGRLFGGVVFVLAFLTLLALQIVGSTTTGAAAASPAWALASAALGSIAFTFWLRARVAGQSV